MLFQKFIYVFFFFLAVLGLCCCSLAFSRGGEWGLLIVVASLVEQRFWSMYLVVVVMGLVAM